MFEAIELISKTDANGFLRLDYKLDTAYKNVRVLILSNEDNSNDDELLWNKSVSTNPAFDFLKDPAEDIYRINDGVAVND